MLEKSECGPFDEVCTIQSFITSWSSISSFFWTVALAFYLYLTLVHTKIFLANRLIPFFHVFNWGIPIAICLPLLVTWKLGYSPHAASTWCYIRKNNHHTVAAGLILVAGKLWEILSYFFVIGLYTTIKCHIRKQVCRVNIMLCDCVCVCVCVHINKYVGVLVYMYLAEQ